MGRYPVPGRERVTVIALTAREQGASGRSWRRAPEDGPETSPRRRWARGDEVTGERPTGLLLVGDVMRELSRGTNATR